MNDENKSLEGELWPIRAKLKGIAYLIQDRDANAPIPLDVDDCYYGIGELLNELAEKIGEVSRHFTEREFEKRKKKHKKAKLKK